MHHHPEPSSTSNGSAGAKSGLMHDMGHGHDMSMQDMAQDMRNRFVVALMFAIPVFLFSPMGQMLGSFATPWGVDPKRFLFVLTTGAIVYPGWPFYVAAWRAMRAGVAAAGRKQIIRPVRHLRLVAGLVVDAGTCQDAIGDRRHQHLRHDRFDGGGSDPIFARRPLGGANHRLCNCFRPVDRRHRRRPGMCGERSGSRVTLSCPWVPPRLKYNGIE